ncbi:MAG: nitric oxide reductase activation protein NorD [Candidatus Thiodiazotropha sp. (ex. Lucinisca nassula)]|uniref:nitric oxide reductase activation protein NorD n=1 Tax=Candidatus Thiodiazotropha sp. LNASS1 TaxID=3096260 RepID=UPI000D3842A5|nr:nitric oxide reductase activation protein NorD [Candidatus Thiodiazotropha sp. (ex. Lucinisca nassula)]MBW9273756.1 nitric oxide reductase activation protein NorD [Candidatus Thiodiazotropha sp. (ex. Lucinisca nassula)]PUB83203.1 MAG: VWA domain-containing protein [gamma proteobacterium symbiont of Ctena orbiculata]PUB90416.1 MAG: VWA domain-containing protein [gamma proteobacterium symbiont of Ctena orbiculata]
MSVDFSEYITCLDEGDHEHLEALESSYHEAQRVMSPRGLQNYLEGMRAFCTLGRGQDLVLTYVQEMPGVAKEVGEDIVPDIVEAMMKLASHTSGSVITLIVANLPLAASRLGDAEVMRGFLKLLHQMTGKAPRGLRPMMENLDELLSKLTLGGLRRWVMWGAQAHQRDLDGQLAYFGLQTESARSILQSERRGTLFIDNQRKLNFYLRALWARAFFMRPTAGDFESRQGIRPFIENFQIHVPDAFDPFRGIDGMEVYRAAAAHAAAHMVYTREPISAEQLSQAQMRMIELFEDARVEYLAYSTFPGLRKLWLQFLTSEPGENDDFGKPHETMDLMMRTTRAIMDRDYRDEIDVINQVADDFVTKLEEDPYNPHLSWMAGVDFYNKIVEIAKIPSVRILSEWPIPYRDDNRYFWDFSENMFESQGIDYLPTSQKTVRRYVSLMEFVNDLDSEMTHDNPDEILVLSTELFPYEDMGVSYNEMEGVEPVSDPYHYNEWDYHVQLARPDWATVIERKQGVGDPEMMDEILTKHKPIASRIRHLIDALQPQGIVRRRGYEEGEELDLNAAVRAMIDIRRGVMPDPRINIRITRHIRDLSIVLLLDLSESTNEKIGDIAEGEEGYEDQDSILDLTRESAGLLSWAIDSIGDNFAVHGFASDGRHDVQYYRFKDFEQSYDDEAKSRMAGMKGGLSTRMGAALRHAGWHLTQQNAQKRLVLLVTDGEPADIDERDPQYLRHDAKKAVEDLAMQGVYTYCLTLDPNADRYVARIFGENGYSIVDNVERLPERLPSVFAALTG